MSEEYKIPTIEEMRDSLGRKRAELFLSDPVATQSDLRSLMYIPPIIQGSVILTDNFTLQLRDFNAGSGNT